MELAHVEESLLDMARNSELTITTDILTTLLETNDLLREMLGINTPVIRMWRLTVFTISNCDSEVALASQKPVSWRLEESANAELNENGASKDITEKTIPHEALSEDAITEDTDKVTPKGSESNR